MKKLWIAMTAVTVVLLGGCATTEPIWFIATPGYVEAQIATSETATRSDYDARIADLQAKLDAQSAVAEELTGMRDIISEVEGSNKELLGLADQLQDRLAALPEETLQKLVDILQQYLQETEAN